MNIPSFIPRQFTLSWYGSGFAIGGKPEDVQILANTLNNFDDSEPLHADLGSFADEATPDDILAVERDVATSFKTGNRRSVSIHQTHKLFAYLVVSEADLVKAFETLNYLNLPRTGYRSLSSAKRRVRLARKLAPAFVAQIPRENFLIGQNLRLNAFAGAVDVNRVASAPSCDGDRDWLDDAVLAGVSKAQGETVLLH